MSTWGVIGVGLLLSTVARVDFSGVPAPQHRADRNEVQSTTEVPFDFYNDNLIIAKATVGPFKDVNMILDTGTSPSAISTELAERLALHRTPELLQTLNGTIQAQSVIVPRVQIGSLDANSLRVLVQDLRFMERSLGIPLGGIAGLDILRTGSFTIDYPRKRIVFGFMETHEKVVRFETQAPFLVVNANIEGHKLRLLVDSGTWGLLVYRNRLQATSQRIQLDRNVSISNLGGKTRVGWLRAEVSLGNFDLGTQNVAIADIDSNAENGFDGLLGFAKMGFHRVSFDFKNGLLGWD
jgi:predicted aspartyl protease